MKCSLCTAWFGIHEKTYNVIQLPETGSSGMWKKSTRGALKMETHDICEGCLKTIQDAIVACKTGRRREVEKEAMKTTGSGETVVYGVQEVETNHLSEAVDRVMTETAGDFAEEDE